MAAFFVQHHGFTFPAPEQLAAEAEPFHAGAGFFIAQQPPACFAPVVEYGPTTPPVSQSARYDDWRDPTAAQSRFDPPAREEQLTGPSAHAHAGPSPSAQRRARSMSYPSMPPGQVPAQAPSIGTHSSSSSSTAPAPAPPATSTGRVRSNTNRQARFVDEGHNPPSVPKPQQPREDSRDNSNNGGHRRRHSRPSSPLSETVAVAPNGDAAVVVTVTRDGPRTRDEERRPTIVSFLVSDTRMRDGTGRWKDLMPAAARHARRSSRHHHRSSSPGAGRGHTNSSVPTVHLAAADDRALDAMYHLLRALHGAPAAGLPGSEDKASAVTIAYVAYFADALGAADASSTSTSIITSHINNHQAAQPVVGTTSSVCEWIDALCEAFQRRCRYTESGRMMLSGSSRSHWLHVLYAACVFRDLILVQAAMRTILMHASVDGRGRVRDGGDGGALLEPLMPAMQEVVKPLLGRGVFFFFHPL